MKNLSYYLSAPLCKEMSKYMNMNFRVRVYEPTTGYKSMVGYHGLCRVVGCVSANRILQRLQRDFIFDTDKFTVSSNGVKITFYNRF